MTRKMPNDVKNVQNPEQNIKHDNAVRNTLFVKQ